MGSYDITKWNETGNTNSKGLPLVNAKAMKVGVFPMFLEGPVRYMKTIQDDEKKMTDMYERVLTSVLRDEQLKMYYLSASLTGQSYDMGRQVAFSPGWLENQSIWMHMSYKYYLQLLRGKLYDKFFAEYRGGGILPFMDPDTYGRPLIWLPLPSLTPTSTEWVSWHVYLVLLLSLWIFISLCSMDQTCSTSMRKTRSSLSWSL